MSEHQETGSVNEERLEKAKLAQDLIIQTLKINNVDSKVIFPAIFGLFTQMLNMTDKETRDVWLGRLDQMLEK